jgi:iron complex transport system permease protein
MRTAYTVRTVAIFLIANFIIFTAASALFGSEGWAGVEVWHSLQTAWPVIQDIRLPRGLGAWLAGALLGVSGALAQGLFRNPLADPFLLGSASGASLGVMLLLALWGSSPLALSVLQSLGLTGAAFLGALAGVLLTLMLARGAASSMRLLLAGVVVGVMLGACSSLILSLTPELLVTMQGFMLGSTAFLGWGAVLQMAVAMAVALGLGLMGSRVLDALSLGEETAGSLGLNVPKLRLLLVAVLALACGTAVAHTGLVAFVGLAAPHLIRSVARVQHRALLVLSALCGGLLLQVADLLSRALLAPRELPVGVLTALIGGLYLLWLMHRGQALEGRSA